MNTIPAMHIDNSTVRLPPPPEIIRQYGPLVSSIARRMIANPVLAEDAAQNAWLEILKSLPTFQARSALSTWIYTIASRVIMRTIQKERVYTRREMAALFDKMQHYIPAPADIERELRVKETCDKCLTGFLYCLDTESKLAFLLRELGDLPSHEIAVILDKNAASVRQIISRSKKKLTAFMDDRCFLFNPEGSCTCRIKKEAVEIDLPATVHKMKQMLGKVRFYKAMDRILPRKNYWKKYL